MAVARTRAGFSLAALLIVAGAFACAAAPKKARDEVSDAERKQAAIDAGIVEQALRDGDLVRANEVAEVVMQLDPFSPTNNLVVARARAAQAVVDGNPRKYDDAVKQAGLACDASPDSAVAFYTRGKLQYDRNYFDSALLDLKKSVDLDPHQKDARLLIVRAHRKLRQPIAEKKALEELIAAEPNDALGYTELGAILVASRDDADAARGEELLKKAVELDPENDIALHHLAELRVEDGDLAGAETILRQAASAAAGRAVREADALYNLGAVLHLQGKSAEARAIYERCLALRPDDRRALGNLGLLLAEAGEKDEARAKLRSAVEFEKDAAVKKKLEAALDALDEPATEPATSTPADASGKPGP